MSPDRETLDALRIDRSRAPQNSLSTAFVLTGIVLIGVAAGVVWWLNQPRAVEVRTAEAVESTSGGNSVLLNASGYVTARNAATVSSKITAKVVEVRVEEGMTVEAGQVLARLDASNVERSLRLSEAQLQLAQTALGETEPELEQAERDLKRISQLFAKNAASQLELDQADTTVKSLRARMERQQAEVEVAERELGVWKQQLDDTIIRAPFRGIVISKDAQPGEMISPMSVGGFTRTGICTIVDMSSLEIEVDVSESYINRVEAGQPVEATLDSYPDLHLPAKVIAIIPTADRQKATVQVRVGFVELDPRILPEMSVKVAFQSSEPASSARRTVSVPKQAVRRFEDRDVVWIVRHGTVERRAVTVESVGEERAILAAGVSGGETVVVEGPREMADGMKVTEGKQ